MIKNQVLQVLKGNCMRSSQTPLTSVGRHWGPLGAEVARSRKPFQAVSHVAEIINSITDTKFGYKGSRNWTKREKDMQGCLGEQGGRKREMKMGWKRTSLGNGEERTKEVFYV